jgi:hypothetical protein
MNCEFCNKIFSNNSSLNNHKRTAKYCLKLQDNKEVINFNCDYCIKIFTSRHNLNLHLLNCKDKDVENIRKQKDKEIEILTKEKDKEIEIIRKEKDKEIEIIRKENKKQEEQIKVLQETIERMGLRAIERPNNNLIEIEIDTDKEVENEYKLTPLEIENGLIIENREDDGYINITNLCKAGNKQFKHWEETEKSKAYLQALSSQVGIPISDLIKIGIDSTYKNLHTWVHPQVAINIAQWISPYFDVKVSAWVYEIYLTGKVDISNTKTYHELKQENKNKELKITFLTNKYVKKQKRKDFKNDNNVIYILTTENLKKERIYIFGKAKKLKNRISTYNKSEEHEVVYYKECKNEQIMSCVENMVFNKLSEYRQQANRERFLLPVNKEIDYFIDIVNSSIKFLN